MQCRGFPHEYSNSQVEIPTDGSETGGRLGKISVNVIDKIMADYGDARLLKSEFGEEKNPIQFFTKCDTKKFKEWYKMYSSMKLKAGQGELVKDGTTESDFLKGMEKARYDSEIAKRMCHKLQGLKLMSFFVKHADDISDIMYRMIMGAKKTSKDNCYFIKIY